MTIKWNSIGRNDLNKITPIPVISYSTVEYVWSSYQWQAPEKAVKLSTPHEEYLRLGETGPERQEAYRAMFHSHVVDELIKDIRLVVNKALALGADRFKDEIERLYWQRVRPAKMGRPRLRSESN